MEEFTIGNPAIQAVDEGKGNNEDNGDFYFREKIQFYKDPLSSKSCYGIQKQSVRLIKFTTGDLFDRAFFL